MSGELQKTMFVTTTHTLNATADLTTLVNVLQDFQANKTWSWTADSCFAEPFNAGGLRVGGCFADVASVSKLQAGSIGPFPVQWWAQSGGAPGLNSTLLSTQSTNLTSFTQLLRASSAGRISDHSDGFYLEEFEDFKTGPQPAGLFVLPARCPQ